jgi:hypothetical protein
VGLPTHKHTASAVHKSVASSKTVDDDGVCHGAHCADNAEPEAEESDNKLAAAEDSDNAEPNAEESDGEASQAAEPDAEEEKTVAADENSEPELQESDVPSADKDEPNAEESDNGEPDAEESDNGDAEKSDNGEPNAEESDVPSADKDEPNAEESDNGEPNAEESDGNAEKSDNGEPNAEESDVVAEVDSEDEDTPVQLVNPAEDRVMADLDKMQQAVAESKLKENMRKMASDDLAHIKTDVENIHHSDAQRAQNLKKAIHDRIEAFRLILADNAEADEDVADEPEVQVVPDTPVETHNTHLKTKNARVLHHEVHVQAKKRHRLI